MCDLCAAVGDGEKRARAAQDGAVPVNETPRALQPHEIARVVAEVLENLEQSFAVR